MKRILLFIVVVIFLFGTAKVNAQDVKFAAKSGLNLAKYKVKEVNLDTRTSIHFGVAAEYKLNDKFAVQPELLYSRQGAKLKNVLLGNFDKIDITVKLDYLNLPVMFKYYVAKGFSLHSGPQLGVLFSSKVSAEKRGDSLVKGLEDIFKTIDFGLNLGLGYKVNNNLFFDARYNLGLANIAKEGGDIKNRIFQISAGYIF